MELKLIGTTPLKEYDFLANLKPENGFENDAYGLTYEQFVNEYIPYIENMHKGINLKESYIPCSLYLLWDNDNIVGCFHIRHYLNKTLKHGAGHIGYAIGTKYRHQGYASKGLEIAIKTLKEIKEFNDDEIYISCNKDNQFSLKVILNNNGYIHHYDEKKYYCRIPYKKNNSKIDIVIATGNVHKMGEYKQLFKDFPCINITCLKDENINVEIDENGSSFKENSSIKANTIKQYTNKYVLADDSGLEIDALDGFPGIYSARFMKDEPYPVKWAAILEKLKDKYDRGAQFHCVLTLISPDNKEYVFEGIERGYIVKEIKGINGFGYDPIFYSNTLNKTFGDANEKEKNDVSHRGRAFKLLADFIIENM